MLTEKDQLILLELLGGKKTRIWLLKNTKLFCNEPDFYNRMNRLKELGVVFGSAYWKLTNKGILLAKLLALLPNNPKDYTKNLKSEIIEFIYEP